MTPRKPLQFKIGRTEYLFPKEQGLTYPQMEELVARTNRENPPKRGRWEVGIPLIWDVKLLAELDGLGVLPPGFYNWPIVSGAFYKNWEQKIGTKTYVGWIKPRSEEMWSWVCSVYPHTQQGVFFTNWSTQ